jgi:hypothetical protein
LLQQIASSLVTAGLYEKAGDLYEQVRSFQQAMEAYRAGGAFRRAIELARTAYPSEVVTLEEQWGDQLSSQKQYNAAITHFIEAGYVGVAGSRGGWGRKGENEGDGMGMSVGKWSVGREEDGEVCREGRWGEGLEMGKEWGRGDKGGGEGKREREIREE